MATILLIEDDPVNRELIRRRIAWSGHHVESPLTTGAALALLETLQPDLILLDLGLPEIDGWELAARIRATPHTRHTPIIALTARTRPADHARSLSAGCDDVETKPINFKRLLEKIGGLTGSV